MKIPSLHNGLNKTTLDRILRKDAVDRAVRWIRYFIIAICIIATSWGLKEILENILLGETAITEMNNFVEAKISGINNSVAKKKEPVSYKKIVKQQIFGRIGAQKAETKPVPNLGGNYPTTTIPLKLVGVYLWDDGDHAATIQKAEDKNVEDTFSLNEKIVFSPNYVAELSELADAPTLAAVYHDRVEIVDPSGRREVLFLEDDVTSSSTTDPASEAIIVKESDLDAALSNLPQLLQQARAVPYFKDGKSIGLRLFAIRPGSLYEKVGLQNGDILKEINGNSMSDITQAIKLFETLKQEKNIIVKLERQRVDKTLRYSIR
ncbi:MAG: type II secretion system protein N [Bdellovibrionota bacterium]|jgi:type II secretion system protein C